MSVRLWDGAKATAPTPAYAMSSAAPRDAATPVTASTRPPLVTSDSGPPGAAVPAWYTVTPAIASASATPAMAMPLGYFSGYLTRRG